MLQVKYTCGTCGQEIIDIEIFNDGKLQNNCIAEKKIWHECCDGYVVPLQSVVEKMPTPAKVQVIEKAPVFESPKKAKHEKANHK